MNDSEQLINDIRILVGLEFSPFESQEAMLEAIKKEVAILVENEEKQDNYFKSELKVLSDYYRRRIGYIAKLTGKPARDPQERLAQVWRNCDEILRDKEQSVRFLTSMEEGV